MGLNTIYGQNCCDCYWNSTIDNKTIGRGRASLALENEVGVTWGQVYILYH